MCGQGSLRLKKWRIQVPIRRDTDLRLLTCFPRCPEGSSWNLKVGAGELGARRGLGGRQAGLRKTAQDWPAVHWASPESPDAQVGRCPKTRPPSSSQNWGDFYLLGGRGARRPERSWPRQAISHHRAVFLGLVRV